MAAGDQKIVTIAGAASTNPVTALSNYNTAVATLMANASDAIWLPVANGGIWPKLQTGGVAVIPVAVISGDQAVPNVVYWGTFSYPSAS